MQLTIKRHTTIALLAVTTVAIVFVTMWLSGKSYSKVEPMPFEGVRLLWHRLETRTVPTSVMAAILMPIIGNFLLFLPWGFLLFITLYSVDRPTVQTYVLTTLLGFSFSLGIEMFQYFLPSRVVDINDVIWNTAGNFAGALLGHMRLRVRFEFE